MYVPPRSRTPGSAPFFFFYLTDVPFHALFPFSKISRITVSNCVHLWDPFFFFFSRVSVDVPGCFVNTRFLSAAGPGVIPPVKHFGRLAVRHFFSLIEVANVVRIVSAIRLRPVFYCSGVLQNLAIILNFRRKLRFEGKGRLRIHAPLIHY